MKKLYTIVLLFAMVFSLTGCGNGNNNDIVLENPESIAIDDGSDSSVENDSESEMEAEDTSETEEVQAESDFGESAEAETSGQGSNILVAYFSRVGNTEWVDGVDAVTSASINVENGEFVGNAEYLAKVAAEASGGDLFLIETVDSYPSDYRETTDQAKVEQNDNARPALASHVENIDSYDTIILIYPNWWGTLPQPLFTFLEEYDFSGKTILPLCTHGGSRMGSSENDITSLCPNATLLEGLAVSGSGATSAGSEVENWINNSGILK